MTHILTPPEKPLRTGFVDPNENRNILHYYSKLKDAYRYTRNFGLALDDKARTVENKPVLLENLFVSQGISTKYLQPEDMIRREREKENFPETWIYEALSEHQRLFLLGAPGTGKTSLVHWLVLVLTFYSSNHVKDYIGHVVPFPMILRELPLAGVDTWEKLWQCFMEKTGCPLKAELVQELHTNGQSFFCVDGLDEIADPSTRKGLGQALLEGMNRFPRCRFLITSRIVGFSQAELFDGLVKSSQSQGEYYSHGTFEDEALFAEEGAGLSVRKQEQVHDFLPVRYIAPFTAQQIRTFVLNWYRQYEPDTSRHKERVDDLTASIARNEGLGQLSRIPVLLNMICFIHGRRARLPEGRAELYERIAQTYLVSMDKARGIQSSGHEMLDYHDLSNWLGTLAFQMQKQRGTEGDSVLAKESEVRAIFEQGLKEKGLDAKSCTAHCDHIVAFIVRRSGFLVPVGNVKGEELFAFNHLSFVEYFAALALDEKISLSDSNSEMAGEIRAYMNEPHWTETFVLLFEMQTSVARAKRLAQWLFGEKKAVTLPLPKNKEDEDVSPAWLVVAQVAMDTTVRLPLEWRTCLIDAAWGAVRYCITSGWLLWQEHRIAAQVITALFRPQYNSLEVFQEQYKEQQELSFFSAQIQDLSPLQDLKNLERLYLRNTAVTDLSPLRGLENLKWLYLDNTAVTDLSPLQGLENLRGLDLRNTAVTDLSPLSGLTKLERLDLENTAVTDLSPLQGLKNLQMLNLRNTAVSDLSPLRDLINLESLDLKNTAVTDLSPLRGLENLKELVLRNTAVTDISPLRDLINLESLDLRNTAVTDLSPLHRLKNLKWLYLINTAVTDLSSIRHLQQCKIVR